MSIQCIKGECGWQKSVSKHALKCFLSVYRNTHHVPKLRVPKSELLTTGRPCCRSRWPSSSLRIGQEAVRHAAVTNSPCSPVPSYFLLVHRGAPPHRRSEPRAGEAVPMLNHSGYSASGKESPSLHERGDRSSPGGHTPCRLWADSSQDSHRPHSFRAGNTMSWRVPRWPEARRRGVCSFVHTSQPCAMQQRRTDPEGPRKTLGA